MQVFLHTEDIMAHQHLPRRERQILDIVYKLGRATAQEVQERLPDKPSYSAVRAVLRGMEEKGLRIASTYSTCSPRKNETVAASAPSPGASRQRTFPRSTPSMHGDGHGRGIDGRCDQRDAIAEPVDALALGSGFGGAVWAAAMVGT